ncbi:TIGR04211 family SH3 domain-containing protein [Spiribacter roseus]|uniref:TIGR04211 family SH3 domain-containing protein n=1 Tax=Spiribacter roseus TaxID=1855875 RepID=A0ABV3S2U9_9GAMM|nr:TIGR04211 family SH3 domain-containing protein [Spiribacter roseus]
MRHSKRAMGRALALGGLIAAAIAGSGMALAQTTAYVTDALEITLRSGQGNDYRILRLLESGEQLEVLQRGETWTRVRAGNDEGWVRSVYLDAEPGAAARLEQAVSQRDALRDENRDLSEQVAALESQVENLSSENERLREDNQRMTERLQEADEGLQLADENQALRKEVLDLERQVNDLSREANRAADQESRDWFIAGAGVIVFGMLLGILVTRIRWRRRSNWSEL